MSPRLVFREGVPTPITSEFINERIRVIHLLCDRYRNTQSFNGVNDALSLILCVCIYSITMESRVTIDVFPLRTLAWTLVLLLITFTGRQISRLGRSYDTVGLEAACKSYLSASTVDSVFHIDEFALRYVNGLFFAIACEMGEFEIIN
jgi:hypothetical protein